MPEELDELRVRTLKVVDLWVLDEGFVESGGAIRLSMVPVIFEGDVSQRSGQIVFYGALGEASSSVYEDFGGLVLLSGEGVGFCLYDDVFVCWDDGEKLVLEE